MYMIGEALKRGVVVEDDLFSVYVPFARDAISFFDDQNFAAMRAVDAWALVGRTYHVVKDIRVLIGKMIWADRASAKYFLPKYSTPLPINAFAFGSMEVALDSIDGFDSSPFGSWGEVDESSTQVVLEWPKTVDWSEDIQVGTAWPNFDFTFDFDCGFCFVEEEATFGLMKSPVDDD